MDLGRRMDRAEVANTRWERYDDGYFAVIRGVSCRVTGGRGSWWTAYVGDGFGDSIGAYATAAERWAPQPPSVRAGSRRPG